MKFATTILVFCVAALLALGMVMLYSAGMAKVGAHYAIVQGVWCAIGLVAAVALALMDYRLLKKIVLPALVLVILGLIAVKVPMGGLNKPVNGARRWLHLGSFNLQVSELAKLALILWLAWYGEKYQRQMGEFKRGLLYPGTLVLLVLGLIYIEPDRGTTALLASVSGVLLLLAGIRVWYFLPPAVLGIAVFIFALIKDPLRLKRLLSWLDQEATKEGIGYQAYQAKIALGAGGVTGVGLCNGRQKLGFVPEHHTDFIFSIIGEELGFIASLIVILLFIVFVICGLYIAWRAQDRFGFLLGSGLTYLIGLQAFVNIGVVSSALPNKGLPLPFISYGGSNLCTMLAFIGIMLSIARQCPEHVRESTKPAAGRQPSGRNPFAAAQAT